MLLQQDLIHMNANKIDCIFTNTCTAKIQWGTAIIHAFNIHRMIDSVSLN